MVEEVLDMLAQKYKHIQSTGERLLTLTHTSYPAGVPCGQVPIELVCNSKH